VAFAGGCEISRKNSLPFCKQDKSLISVAGKGAHKNISPKVSYTIVFYFISFLAKVKSNNRIKRINSAANKS